MRPHVTPRLAARGGQGGAGSHAQPSSLKTPTITESLCRKADEHIHVQLLPRCKAPPWRSLFLQKESRALPRARGPSLVPLLALLRGASPLPAFTRSAPGTRALPRTRHARAVAGGSTFALPLPDHSPLCCPHSCLHTWGSSHSVTSARSALTALFITAGSSPETSISAPALSPWHLSSGNIRIIIIIIFFLLAFLYCLSLPTLEHKPHENRDVLISFVSLLYS